METRNIRDLAILLPGEAAGALDTASGVPRDQSTVTDVLVEGDVWRRVKADRVSISRSWLINADLSAIDLTAATFDRCVLRGCTLVGAQLTETILKNVILENCRLDYATLTTVRANGPVAFIGCSLTEATFERCKLNAAVFDNCQFRGSAFAGCDMRGTDLRGNDLSQTTGVTTSLRGCVIAESQLPAFMEAVTRELELKVKP